MQNRYNLLDEKWIEIVDGPPVSITDIFKDRTIRDLGGTPVEKISIMKLLLAVSQAAFTPSEEEYQNSSSDILSEKVLDYLEKNHDLFFLYGERPFLQVPSVRNYDKNIVNNGLMNINTFQIDIPSGNGSIFFDTQRYIDEYSDEEKARYIVTEVNFARKRKINSNPDFDEDGSVHRKDPKKKNKEGEETKKKGLPSAPGGLALGNSSGYMHCFYQLGSVLETLWLNLLTKEQISSVFPEGGVGIPPWEKTPSYADDEVSKALSKTYIGTLVPMSSFIIYEGNRMRYVSGIHSFDPLRPDLSVPFRYFDKKVGKEGSETVKATDCLNVDVDKKPWREIPSLLCLDDTSKNAYRCYMLRNLSGRLRRYNDEDEIFNREHPENKRHTMFYVWAGGVSVAHDPFGHAWGESAYISSSVSFPVSIKKRDTRFLKLAEDIAFINKTHDSLDKSVKGYYKGLNILKTGRTSEASRSYWLMCETIFSKLASISGISDEDEYSEKRKQLRGTIIKEAKNIYDKMCPRNTPRNIKAWAENLPFRRNKKKTGRKGV